MTTFTIKLEDGVAEAVRRRAAERGTAAEDVLAQAVRDRFHSDEVPCPVPVPDDDSPGGRLVRHMAGRAKPRLTFEEIAEHTRSDA